MKTQLVFGLVMAFGAVCGSYASFHATSTWAIGFYALCGAFSGFVAARILMEALFGNEGLLFDLGRRVERAAVREERELPPRKRPVRITHPSETLRKRGAEGRLRIPRRKASCQC